MRFIGISIFILLSNFSIGQTSWFRHLPGWQARTTLVKGDTLLTCGMDYVTLSFGDRFNTFLYWNNLKGDSLGFYKIKLDSLENDTTRSTVISYNYSSSVIQPNGSFHFVNLRYGGKKSRAFLLTMKNFYGKNITIEEYTVDTSSTFINNLIYSKDGNISFVPYAIVEKPLERTYNTLIYKETNGKRVKIKEIVNYPLLKYETTCHIKNNRSNANFFFKMREMWDYAGAPRMWADYIIKMDTNGNQLWQCYPNNRDSINTEGMQMVQKPNGNLLVSWCDYYYRPYKNLIGSQQPQLNRRNTVWFAEIDSSGKVLWRKNIKNYLSGKIKDTTQSLGHNKAIITRNGVIWTGNYSYYYNHNYLLKTDFDGNPIWYREYELYPSNTAEQEFKPCDVTATSDGGYVLTGEYISDKGNIFKNGCQLATIIKVDSFGCLLPDCQKADSATTKVSLLQKSGFKIYPNPNSGNFTIEIENPAKDVSIEVLDMMGKHLASVERVEKVNSLDLDIADGMYWVRVKNGGAVYNQKVSVVK